jgi:phosphoribosylglycinamide formyltransferase-1
MTSQKAKAKLVILVHEGSTHTNLKAIKRGVEAGTINAEIIGVFSDISPLPPLDPLVPDYICLAGWKKIIPDELISKYKILNLHPGLIPDTLDGTILNPDGTTALSNRGLYADKTIQNFLDKKATYAGSSIHYLTNVFDFGPVLGRTFEKIEPGDTVESLYARLKMKEGELYVKVLSDLTNA